MYHVYMVECSDGSLYAGWTTDLSRRVKAHNASKVGAKYTRARRPVRLVYSAAFETRSLAMKEEARLKKMSRHGKLLLMGRSKLDSEPAERIHI